MRKILLVLFMAPSLAFALSCKEIEAAASGAAYLAQSGTSFLDAYKTTEGMAKAEREFVKKALLDAYATTPGRTIYEKSRIIQRFKNKYAMECVRNE